MITEEMYIPVTESGCWIWLRTVNSGGYGNIKFKGKTYGSHQAAYIDEHGEIPEGMQILHKCDCRLCVNPNHLYAGTHKQNMDDKRARKRSHNIKYTEDIKREITEKYQSGARQVDLAIEYGTKQCYISKLIDSYLNDKAMV